jgi:hypothetical protein
MSGNMESDALQPACKVFMINFDHLLDSTGLEYLDGVPADDY